MSEELGKEGFATEALPHLEAVHRFALRLAAGDEDEAGDLVQETFLRAYRAWEGFARGTNCRAWLFTICRNVFLRARERRGRAMEVGPRRDLWGAGHHRRGVGERERRPERASSHRS